MLNFFFHLSSSLLKLLWRIALVLGGAVLYSFGRMIWGFLTGKYYFEEEEMSRSQAHDMGHDKGIDF